MSSPQPVRAAPRCPRCHDRRYAIRRDGAVGVAEICECARHCSICEGRGWVLGEQEETFSQRMGPRQYEVLTPCSCTLLRRRVASFGSSGIPGAIAHAELGGVKFMKAAQNDALDRARSFALGYHRGGPNRGFVLSGPPGTGKTHLLAATLTHLALEVGVPVQYREISLLYADIRHGFQEGKSGGDIIGPLSEVEVLAIDELGKGRGSQFELDTLDELIARRYNGNRTTLFATNYSLAPEEIRPPRSGDHESRSDRMKASADPRFLSSRVGERIYSRLCEMCDFIEFPPDTPDYRRLTQERFGGHGGGQGASRAAAESRGRVKLKRG